MPPAKNGATYFYSGSQKTEIANVNQPINEPWWFILQNIKPDSAAHGYLFYDYF